MIMLVRHPGGRTGWKFENKLSDQGVPCTEYDVANKEIDENELGNFEEPQKFNLGTVPPGVEKIPTTRADYSIPDAVEVAETAEVHNLKQINQIRWKISNFQPE